MLLTVWLLTTAAAALKIIDNSFNTTFFAVDQFIRERARAVSARWDGAQTKYNVSAWYLTQAYKEVFQENVNVQLLSMSDNFIYDIVPRNADYVKLNNAYALITPRKPVLTYVIEKAGGHGGTLILPRGHNVIIMPGPNSHIFSHKSAYGNTPYVMLVWQKRPTFKHFKAYVAMNRLEEAERQRGLRTFFKTSFDQMSNQFLPIDNDASAKAAKIDVDITFPTISTLYRRFPFRALQLWQTLWRHMSSDEAVAGSCQMLYPGCTTSLYAAGSSDRFLVKSGHILLKIPLIPGTIFTHLVPLFHMFQAYQPVFLVEAPEREAIIPISFAKRGFFIPSKLHPKVVLVVLLQDEDVLPDAMVVRTFITPLCQSWELSVPSLDNVTVDDVTSRYAMENFPMLQQFTQ